MCYDAVVDSYYLIPAFLNQENVFDSCQPEGYINYAYHTFHVSLGPWDAGLQYV